MRNGLRRFLPTFNVAAPGIGDICGATAVIVGTDGVCSDGGGVEYPEPGGDAMVGWTSALPQLRQKDSPGEESMPQ